MLDTRRCFLKNLAEVSSFFLIFQTAPPMPTPTHRTPVDPPAPAEKQEPETPMDNSRSVLRARLHAQEKEFRETMVKLFAKVRDLKLQVDETRPSDVFSIAIFKQTQEIEKLAKQLKNYART